MVLELKSRLLFRASIPKVPMASVLYAVSVNEMLVVTGGTVCKHNYVLQIMSILIHAGIRTYSTATPDVPLKMMRDVKIVRT